MPALQSCATAQTPRTFGSTVMPPWFPPCRRRKPCRSSQTVFAVGFCAESESASCDLRGVNSYVVQLQRRCPGQQLCPIALFDFGARRQRVRPAFHDDTPAFLKIVIICFESDSVAHYRSQ